MLVRTLGLALVGFITLGLSGAANAGLIGTTVDLNINASVGNPITATNFPINTSVTVTSGVEFSQTVSMTFTSSGFPQTMTGTLTIDIADNSISSSFVGTAQGVNLTILIDNIAGFDITGISDTGSTGILSGVNYVNAPTFTADSMGFNFGMLGYQPGTNMTRSFGFTSTATDSGENGGPNENGGSDEVPEPSLAFLIGFAALGLGLRKRMLKRSST